RLSVRARLTMWYGAMCALTLALAGTAMYVYVQRSLDAEIDQKLNETAAAVNSALSGGLTGPQSTTNIAALRLSPYYVAECDPGITSYLPRWLLANCVRIRAVLDKDSARLSAPGQFEQVILQVTVSDRATGPYTVPPVFITATGHGQTNLRVDQQTLFE